jgi:hypothetical protein
MGNYRKLLEKNKCDTKVIKLIEQTIFIAEEYTTIPGSKRAVSEVIEIANKISKEE